MAQYSAPRKRNRETKDIPHDVVVEILARVPAKSLMRFKCVSRSWQSTIHDPQFTQLHRTYFQTRNIGDDHITNISYCKHQISVYFTVEDHEGNMKPSRSPINLGSPPLICSEISATQALDGLVCFHCPHLQHNPFVFNLSTRQIVTLPRYCFPCVFESCKCFLGFDPANKKYKVVNIIFRPPNKLLGGTSCEIYTLGADSDSRRTIKDPPRAMIDMESSALSCSSSGSIYWMGIQQTSGRNYNSILVLDVGKEVFRVIRLSDPTCYGSLLNLGDGKLGVFSSRSQNISLWILEEVDSCSEKHDTVLVKENLDFSSASSLLSPGRFSYGSTNPRGDQVLLRLPDIWNAKNICLDLHTRTLRIQCFESPHMSCIASSERCSPHRVAFHSRHTENIVRL